MVLTEELDFSKFKYPIHTIPSARKVIDLFDDLKTHRKVLQPEDWPFGLDREKTMRYIIYMYSPGSPAHQIEELGERRLWCLEQAGFETGRGRFSSKIEDMLQGKLDVVNRAMVVFLYLQGSDKFSLLMVLQQSYYTLLKRLQENDLSAIKDISTVEKKIAEVKEAVVAGDTEVNLEESLYRFMDHMRLGIRPEEYVREYVDTGTVFPEIEIGI